MEPQIRYAKTTDGVTIAYAVSGEGKALFVHTSNDLSASLQHETVGQRRWLDALGERFSVIRYDSRGTGLSQRDCDDLSIAALTRDLAAVIDSTSADPVVLYGHLGGSFAAAAYAREYPDRVRRLVFWPVPFLDLNDARHATLGRMALADWETFTETYAHIALGWARGEESHQFALGMRATVSKETWLRFMSQFVGRTEDRVDDPFGDLGAIAVPTLVIQRSSFEGFSRVAGAIPGAQTRMFGGEAVGPSSDAAHIPAIVDAIAEFAGAEPKVPTAASGLLRAAEPPRHETAVVLFTDIADSTALTERMGDSAFRSASRELDGAIRAAMRTHAGMPVAGKVLGDGVMGVFASAADAIAASRDCVGAAAATELRLHVGLHAGDVIREGDNVYGGAVNIASRICGLSEPGEVLVSQTVRDLARTSAAVSFDDRGEQALKGVGDSVRVFAVRADAGERA